MIQVLSIYPLPSIKEISEQEEFEVQEITQKEFNDLWKINVIDKTE